MKLSIRWKIILFIILPVVAVYSAFMIVNIIKMQQWAMSDLEDQIKDLTNDYAHRLDAQLQKSALVAALTAAYVEKNPTLSSDMMISMLQANLEQNPLVFGTAIAFDHYAYTPEKKLFIRYIHREGNKLITTGFVFTGYDYTDPLREYWNKPKTTGKAAWSEPYFDEGGGNFLMCTYSVPFFKNSKFAGIALVDIPLEPLRKLALQEIPDFVKFNIITPSGKYVFSSNHDRINKNVTDIEDINRNETLLKFAKTVASHKTGFVRIADWEHPGPELVAYTPVKSTGWGFSVSVSKEYAYKDIEEQFYKNIFYFMLSLFFIVPSLWFFTSRFSKSIFKLNTTVLEFSKGNMNLRADASRNDEIGTLGAAFNHMAAQLIEREKKLFEAQKLFETVIHQTPIPIAVVTSDRKVNIVNDAFNSYLGLGPESEIKPGMDIGDFKPNWQSYYLNGESIPARNSTIFLALNGIKTKDHEMKIVRSDGEIKWTIASGTPVYDKNGTIIAGVIVFPDITDRKRMEENLKESEERFRRITENAKDMIYRMSLPDGKYEYVSPASTDLFGYRPEEFYEHPVLIQKIIHPDWTHFFQKQWDNLLKGEMPPNYEYQIIHKSNQVKWMNQRNVLVKDSQGNPIAIEGIVTDITEAKLAEEEKAKLEADLRQAHKMEAVGTLAGGIAHDFNNILSAIIGYAELAKDDISSSNPAFEEIEEVINAGKRARDLVRHILAFSRKSGETRIPVKPCIIVEEALNLIRASIPTTIEIKHDIDRECGNILADPTQIHQVIMNICTNAAQAMDKHGGTLEISLREEYLLNDHVSEAQPYIKLTIKDTGTGIDKHILDRVFDPYFTTKEYGKGSGMGLAIVHGIVEGHNGKISVESIPGRGTTFCIYFPKITEQMDIEEVVEEPLLGGSESILLVDDEQLTVDVTQQRLTRLGYNVTVKTNSVDALELFRKDPDYFDLVITDQTMPKMTGEQMVRKMMDLRKNIPVILCTGYSSKIDQKKAQEMGIKAFLMKPVGKTALSKIIREVLESK